MMVITVLQLLSVKIFDYKVILTFFTETIQTINEISLCGDQK